MTKLKVTVLVGMLLMGASSSGAVGPYRSGDSRVRRVAGVVPISAATAESAATVLPLPRRGLTVEDSAGNFVGLPVDPLFSVVARRVGDVPMLLMVDPGTRAFRVSTDLGWYETPDCNGQAFMDAGGLMPFADVGPDLSVNYPSPPYAERTVVAYEYGGVTEADCLSSTNTIFIPPDRCCQNQSFSPQTFLTGAMTTDRSLMNLIAPFHVEGL